MEGDGSDRGVKTFRILGERNCLVVNVKPGSIVCNDCYKVVDNGDCVDLVMEGKIAELPVDAERASRAGVGIDRCIWIAGPGEKKIENGKLVMYTPPCISSFPKKEIDFMTAEQVVKKINLDFLDFTCLEISKVGASMDRQRFEKMMKLDVDLVKEEEDASAAGSKELDAVAASQKEEASWKQEDQEEEAKEAKERKQGSRPDEVK